MSMYTIIELPTFSNNAKSIWDEAERGEFCVWLTENPLAGDVIPKSGGCRKVHWRRSGTGKQGGYEGYLFQQARKRRDLPHGYLRQNSAR